MSLCRYYETIVYGWLAWLTAVAVKTLLLCAPHKSTRFHLQRITAIRDIAVIVTVSFVLSFSVGGLTYVLLNWIL